MTAAWSANLVTVSSVARFADVYLNPEDGDSYICDSLPVDMTSHPRRPETASVQFLLVITPIQYKFSHTVLRNTQYQSMAATSYTSGSSVATSFVVTYASKIVAYLTTLLLGGLHSVDSRWINMVCSVHEMKPETLWKKPIPVPVVFILDSVLFVSRNYISKHYLDEFKKHVIEGKIEGRIEVTGRRGRRRKQLPDDLKETRGYWNWKRKH